MNDPALGRDLVRRGLRAPMLVVTDGAPGLIRAMEELWPDSDRQRCTVHRWRNVAGKLPKNDTQLHQRVEAAYWAALVLVAGAAVSGVFRVVQSAPGSQAPTRCHSTTTGDLGSSVLDSYRLSTCSARAGSGPLPASAGSLRFRSSGGRDNIPPHCSPPFASANWRGPILFGDRGDSHMPRRRVAVFIDYQNCYKAAREAFHYGGEPVTCGQVWPNILANLLASKGPGSYDLAFVGVYCGLADPRKDPKTAAARQKQIKAWVAKGSTVFARPLRYPRDWPESRAEEKGVDVKLALDVVMKAIEGVYDVGILASCDTDLGPVAEALLELKALQAGPEVECLAWKGRGNKIGVPGQELTYRWVGDRDYHAMQDPTDYNL